jgi:hypothetical protein
MKPLEGCVPIELLWWYYGSRKALSRLFIGKKQCFVALGVLVVSEKLSIVGYDIQKDHTQCMVLRSSRVSMMQVHRVGPWGL